MKEMTAHVKYSNHVSLCNNWNQFYITLRSCENVKTLTPD
jgi:hypothetical protein